MLSVYKYLSINIKCILAIGLVTILWSTSAWAQTDLKIGNSPGAITTSAVLEAASTTKGILIPRMTTVQMNAIASPANGLMIYNTTDECIYIYRTSVWLSTCSSTYAMSWGLLGNASTVDGTNFIGTTDNIPLSMRVNNQKSGRIGIVGETYLGYQSGNAVTSGQNNTFLGYQAGTANTNAWSNAAFGYRALYASTTGGANTAIGDSALVATTGGNNVALGYRAGLTNTTGTNNTFLGYGSNVSSSGLTNATAIGYNATVGSSNSLVLGGTGANAVAVGINTTTPAYKLDIDAQTGSGGNPLRLLGLAAGATTDSLITSASGVVRRVAFSQYLGTSAWTTTGNASTVDGTNFIGTTDNIPLSMRVNNQKSGRIGIVGETYLGYQAGNSVTSGQNNSFIGYQSGTANTNAWSNSAFGYRALYSSLTGSANTAIGDSALVLTTGGNNTALGYQAGITNTTGTNNTLIGNSANVSGAALSNATAIGYSAVVGSSNSLVLGGTGANAVAVGINTTTPAYKLDIDAQTGSGGNPLRLLGLAAGATTDSLITSASGVVRRVAFSQYLGTSAWTTTGNASTVDGTNFIGTTDNIPLSMRVNNQKSGRIGIVGETYLGYQAGNSVTSGQNNSFIGYQSGTANTNAWGSTALGYRALYSSATGSANTAVGDSTLVLTTGGNNVALGYRAGITNTTGTTNTFLGSTADASSSALSNATALGYGASVNASNKIRLGNSSVTLVETSGNFVTISDRRLKTNITDNYIGLNFIKAVRPVNYELKSQKGVHYDGFIAQEIDSILQKQGIKDFSGLSRPANTEGYYTVSYATFVVPLVNAVKELDAKNEATQRENMELKAELARMKAENAALKVNVDKNTQDIEAIKAALLKKSE